MPQISIRGVEMPASPIRKLAPLAEAAKRRGLHVYHLNIGQPDLPTPQVALDAIRNIDRKMLEYSPSDGFLSYRQKLTGYYKKYDINLTPEDIIITSGGSEAVLFAFMLQHRSPTHGYEGFGHRVGQRLQARSYPCGKYHRFHS